MKTPRAFSTLISIITIAWTITSCEKKIDYPDEGLILYMPFDKNTKDYSGNQNHGIDSTAGKYVQGVRGQALDFDGLNDYIVLQETLDGTNGLSFSFWLKSRGAQENENNGTVICKYNMVYDYRTFNIMTFGANPTRYENKLIAYYYSDRDIPNAYTDMCMSNFTCDEIISLRYNPLLYSFPEPKKIPLNKWVHCFVNITPSTLELWLNGTLCMKKKREYHEYYDSEECPTVIGNCLSGGGGTNNHLNGVLDELRVYNRSLTSDEIKVLSTY